MVSFVAGRALADLHVSVVTFAEIRFGIEQLTDASRRAELTGWLTIRCGHSSRIAYCQSART